MEVLRKITLLILCTTLLFTVACQNEGSSENTEDVTLVLDWQPNTNHTGVYIAIEKGYYKDAGINLTIELPPEGTALPLVAAGKGDFGISFQEELISSLTSDTPLPLISVAAIIQNNTSGIVSLKENNIMRPKDMEGHNYATWDMPIEHAILKNIITLDGGDYDKLEIIPSSVTDLASALETGIDTAWIYYAWDKVALDVMGIQANFFFFIDINKDLNCYTPIIVSSNSFLEENDDLAKRFIQATKKGYEYAIDNPIEAAEIICKHVPEIDIEIAKESQEYLALEYAKGAEYWGHIDAKRWDTFNKWAFDNGIIPQEMPKGFGFTNLYLESVE